MASSASSSMALVPAGGARPKGDQQLAESLAPTRLPSAATTWSSSWAKTSKGAPNALTEWSPAATGSAKSPVSNGFAQTLSPSLLADLGSMRSPMKKLQRQRPTITSRLLSPSCRHSRPSSQQAGFNLPKMNSWASLGSAMTTMEMSRSASSPSMTHKDLNKQLYCRFEETSPSDSGFLNRGLTRPAQRENFKMEQLQGRIQTSVSSASAPATMKRSTSTSSGFALGATDSEDTRTIGQLEEMFTQEFGMFTAKLEEIKQNMKQDGTEKKNEENSQEAAERRRAERERAERERLLREQAKDARSPKKKVALQIESRREFPVENLPEIPMMVSSIHGVNGNETIAQVNVPALQAMCYPLNDGQSVEKMLQVKDAREKAAKYEKEQTNTTNYVTVNMQSNSIHCRSQLSAKYIKEAQRYESEQSLVKQRKVELHQMKMRHLLDTCRSGTLHNPYLYDIGSGFSKTMPAGVSSQGVSSMTFVSAPSGTFQMTPAGLWLTNLCAAVVLNKLAAKYRWRKNIPNPETQATPEEIAEAQMRRKLAMERWSWVCRIVKVWRSAYLAKKRVQGIKIVKMFCRQMSEAARIKVGMIRFTTNVRKLQRSCREFLNNKHNRTSQMNKLWCHVEDDYLSEYFRVFAKKIMVEEAKRREAEAERKGYNVKSKANTRGLKPGEMAGTEREINWKQFRIPVAARKKAISRLYMEKLRDYVRNCAGWFASAKKAMMAQAEFARFLRSLGGDSTRTVTHDELDDAIPPPAAPNRCFWDMEESDMLNLINKTARSLRHLDQMQNHPAVREGGHDISSFAKSQSQVDKGSEILGKAMARGQAYGLARNFLKTRTHLSSKDIVVQKNLSELMDEFNPNWQEVPDMTEEEQAQLGGPQLPYGTSI